MCKGYLLNFYQTAEGTVQKLIAADLKVIFYLYAGHSDKYERSTWSANFLVYLEYYPSFFKTFGHFEHIIKVTSLVTF